MLYPTYSGLNIDFGWKVSFKKYPLRKFKTLSHEFKRVMIRNKNFESKKTSLPIKSLKKKFGLQIFQFY